MDGIIFFGAEYLIALPVVISLAYALFVHDRRAYLRYAFAVLAISYLLRFVAGQLWYDPLPFVTQGVVPLVPQDPGNGFPSDHALLAGALAAAMTRYSRKLSFFLWGVAALVGLSRVLALVHHPVDIVASFAIAALAALLATALIRRLYRTSHASSSSSGA